MSPIIYSLSDDSIERLNDFFTSQYAYTHWYYKLKTSDLILENIDKFVKTWGKDIDEIGTKASYELYLKSEIVFSFFHISEALFSLIISANTKVPWITMKGLRIKQISDFVRDKVIPKKIPYEFVRFLFYNGVPPKSIKGGDQIDKSIKFIIEYLSRMGKYYLDNQVHDEYKHGLRVMTTNASIQAQQEGKKDAKPFSLGRGTSHVYLQTKVFHKEGKKEYHQIHMTTRSFDYKLYLRMGAKNYQLIHSIFRNRRKLKKLKDGDQIQVSIFDEEDLKELFKDETPQKFKFTIHYPTANPPGKK